MLARFKSKAQKSHVFILGSKNAGASSLLKLLEQKFAMKHQKTQTMAGIELESITCAQQEIYSCTCKQSTFSSVTKMVGKESTQCVIFVIDSRKQHIIHDAQGNDIRSNIKAIAKIVNSHTHILLLCNKQDLTDEDVLSPDEIADIMDINRLFDKNKHAVFGCSLAKNTNTETILSYLRDNHLVVNPSDSTEEEQKNADLDDNKGKIADHKKGGRFTDLFKRKGGDKKKHEVVMLFGLEKAGKTKILDAFGFGKRTKTNIAIFEAETIKYSNTEFHAWNYEQRSWPMCKSFFLHCSLVIFVIDATKPELLKSENPNIWTVDQYLKKLLSTGVDTDVHGDKPNPFRKASNSEDMPLQCPFLFYINRCDEEKAVITNKDLEEQLDLSALMKKKGLRFCVQQCSAKTKTGIYDGLIWCHMNGILTQIPEIKQYAEKNDIMLPSVNAMADPSSLQSAKSK